jgi:hypothetical protein
MPQEPAGGEARVFDLAQFPPRAARQHEAMNKPLPQVGAPDPELKTSPIIDESEYDEHAASPDLEIEAPVCYFNQERFALGAWVQSGDEVLQCTEHGVWVRKGEQRPA